jgi:hypothetical protein
VIIEAKTRTIILTICRALPRSLSDLGVASEEKIGSVEQESAKKAKPSFCALALSQIQQAARGAEPGLAQG